MGNDNKKNIPPRPPQKPSPKPNRDHKNEERASKPTAPKPKK